MAIISCFILYYILFFLWHIISYSIIFLKMSQIAFDEERSLWKAHSELLQKLEEEEKEASLTARKAWEQEREALREQISAAERSCEPSCEPLKSSFEPSELLELEEVRRCLSAVQLALQHSASKKSAKAC